MLSLTQSSNAMIFSSWKAAALSTIHRRMVFYKPSWLHIITHWVYNHGISFGWTDTLRWMKWMTIQLWLMLPVSIFLHWNGFHRVAMLYDRKLQDMKSQTCRATVSGKTICFVGQSWEATSLIQRGTFIAPFQVSSHNYCRQYEPVRCRGQSNLSSIVARFSIRHRCRSGTTGRSNYSVSSRSY